MTDQEPSTVDWRAQALAAMEGDDTDDQAAAVLMAQTSAGSEWSKAGPYILKWVFVVVITLIFMFFFGAWAIGAALCAYWLVFGR